MKHGEISIYGQQRLADNTTDGAHHDQKTGNKTPPTLGIHAFQGYIRLKDEHIQRIEKIYAGQTVQEPTVIEFAGQLPVNETEYQKRGVEDEA
uniref:Uncharacterized protein n=1 Tax=Romanomermis culicivorax TaxID=13658 RepID=A0A915LB88_ROMCU